MGKSLSESDISKSSQRVSDVSFSPEVLYVLVQESVEKFLQNICFWLENESLVQTIQNDNISGAMEDIVRALTPSEEGDMIGSRRSQVQLLLP